MVDHSDTSLGKETAYTDQYDPALLFPISRAKARASGQRDNFFMGVDLWTAYEISWLNPQGIPQVVIGEFWFPCDSQSIVESKSFKLYLNSLIQTQYSDRETVRQLLVADLSRVTGSTVDAVLYDVSEYNGFNPIVEPQGVCLDQQPVIVDMYQPNPDFLCCVVENELPVEECLYSHLLKTNCPVTNQPDWASVYINYKGPAIDRDGLLQYIVSFRQHQDFHEQCVEKIFQDITERCQPSELSVYARYMRRGGLDINPYRSSVNALPAALRQARQ